MTLQTLEKNITDSNDCISLEGGYKPLRADIAISRWMVAGCFEGTIDDAVIAADKINPNETWSYNGRQVCWRNSSESSRSPDTIDRQQQINSVMFEHIGNQGKNTQSSVCLDDYITGSSGVVYLAVYIYSRKNASYLLATECGGAYKVFQNGRQLISTDRTYSTNTNPITLRHGWNLLLVKTQYEPYSYFYGGLCTSEGKPFKDGWIKSGFMEGGDIDTQMFGKNPDDKEQAIEIGYIEDEYKRTQPDSIVYIPKEGDDYNDGDNEHFLVFNAPKSNELLAMWTQGSMEPSGDNHIMLARSADGVNWSQPLWITGTHKGTNETQASWGFPVVAKDTGRIYCFYCESPAGKLGGASGILGCHISDDNGKTWQQKGKILFPDCFEDVNDISSQNGGIIVWQKPIRDSQGKQIVGYTFCGNGHKQGCCRFMRFDNIDEAPDVEDIKISWLSLRGDTISIPSCLDNCHCSEPAIELLPDGRLFVVFRTMTGYIWYSVSDNDGVNWTEPEPLLYKDGGEPVKNPLTCCPLYRLEDGRYVLVYYNNCYYSEYIKANKPLPAGMSMFTHRRPAVYSIGKFQKVAHQPLWFDEPKNMLDTDGVIVSPKASNEVATYPSLTYHNEKYMFWYPDRKFFLLGKHFNF